MIALPLAFTRFGPFLKDDAHLKDLQPGEVITEPPENRGPFQCDGEIGTLCQPCGVRCDEMSCSNQLCSIACLDQDFMNRTQEPNKDRIFFNEFQSGISKF